MKFFKNIFRKKFLDCSKCEFFKKGDGKSWTINCTIDTVKEEACLLKYMTLDLHCLTRYMMAPPSKEAVATREQ